MQNDRNDSVAFLGNRGDHADNLAAILAGSNYRLLQLEDSASAGVYRAPSGNGSPNRASQLLRKADRVYSQVFGTHHASYLSQLVNRIDEHNVKCVLAYWGTGPLGDIVAIKRRKPRLKVILNVLCHPTGLTPSKVAAQNWLFRRSVGACDGLIASSQAMRSYLSSHITGKADFPCAIWPPYLGGKYFPAERLPTNTLVPNVMFLGRMDWARAQPCDNVLQFLTELMGHGVHVNHHKSPESPTIHSFAHGFQYMALPQAVQFATQFDASLIVYNLQACPSTDRFEVTVPDRLVASVAAGIPIAIPRSGYAACKEYLAGYRALIQFDSPAELAEQLKDRARIEDLKSQAREDSLNYRAECHRDELLAFISAITQQ